MTSANESWQNWMDDNWPEATPRTRTVLWALWCRAVLVGRMIERERGPESVRPETAAEGGA